MRCYFCALKLDDSQEHLKPVVVGHDKAVHQGCFAHYKDYLRQIVEEMSGRKPRGEVQ